MSKYGTKMNNNHEYHTISLKQMSACQSTTALSIEMVWPRRRGSFSELLMFCVFAAKLQSETFDYSY